jgi:hypothetical protein
VGKNRASQVIEEKSRGEREEDEELLFPSKIRCRTFLFSENNSCLSHPPLPFFITVNFYDSKIRFLSQ